MAEVLAALNIKGGIRFGLEIVSLPVLHDLAIEHLEGIAASLLALHHEVVLLLGNEVRQPVHLLSVHEDRVAEDIVDRVDDTVIDDRG